MRITACGEVQCTARYGWQLVVGMLGFLQFSKLSFSVSCDLFLPNRNPPDTRDSGVAHE